MKVSVLTNNLSNNTLLLYSIIDILSEINVNILMPTEYKKHLKSRNIEFTDDYYNDSSLCVVVGGDGAVLHYGKESAENDIPVIAINTGRVGFLTSLETSDISFLKDVVEGKVSIEEHKMIDVNVFDENNNIIYSYVGLNEAVVSRGDISKIIDIDIFVNDCFFNDVRGDGVVFSTQTGSTAYSMSAGGPIIAPGVDSLIITPICPYPVSFRPVVIPNSSKVKVLVKGLGAKAAILTVDGDVPFSLKDGMTVVISNSKRILKLLTPDKYKFYKKIKNTFFSR